MRWKKQQLFQWKNEKNAHGGVELFKMASCEWCVFILDSVQLWTLMCRNLSKQNANECVPWCGKSTFHFGNFRSSFSFFSFSLATSNTEIATCISVCTNVYVGIVVCQSFAENILWFFVWTTMQSHIADSCCSNLKRMAIVINNRNRFLIWCYSHKLFCLPFMSSVVDVLFLFWFARIGSILVAVQYPHRPMTLKTYHFWSVTIEPSVCHLAIYILLRVSIALSLYFFCFGFFSFIFSWVSGYIALLSHRACNINYLYAVRIVHDVSCVFVAHIVLHKSIWGWWRTKRLSKTTEPLQTLLITPWAIGYTIHTVHVRTDFHHISSKTYARAPATFSNTASSQRTVWFLFAFDGLNTYHDTSTCDWRSVFIHSNDRTEHRGRGKKRNATTIYIRIQLSTSSFAMEKERERERERRCQTEMEWQRRRMDMII